MFGGEDRARTCDFLLAKQVLYHLSYHPKMIPQSKLDSLSEVAPPLCASHNRPSVHGVRVLSLGIALL